MKEYKDCIHTKAIEHIKKIAKGTTLNESYNLTINFHPDRKTKYGELLLEALIKDSTLKSQFET